MSTLFIKQSIEKLQKDNYKSFYLAFFRVAVSVWLLKEIALNWSSLDMLYGETGFTVSRPGFLNRLPGGYAFVHKYYLHFIVAYILVILLNIAGIGRWFTALLLAIMVHILQRMNFSIVNGGDTMVRLVLFYLVFANSYEYFAIGKKKPSNEKLWEIKNLVSNLAVLSIMIQLCVAYFSLGISKINDPVWRHGEAMYYVLQLERFAGTPFNKYLAQYTWLGMAVNYLVILFETGFPILIWQKNFRKPLLITGILFHLGVYILLMIYGFQVVFVLIYGFFIKNETWVKIYNRLIKKDR